MNRSVSGRKSFTLVEMLLVMVVISMMVGMILRIMILANRQSLKSATIGRLEAIAMALNEFRAEYGMYPGTCTVRYEYESTNTQGSTFYLYLNNHPNYPVHSDPANNNNLFSYGLVSYLWLRYSSSDDDCPINSSNHIRMAFNNVNWLPDNQRDIQAKNRWATFLDSVPLDQDYTRWDNTSPTNLRYNGRADTGYSSPYSNHYATVLDAWEHEIHYECIPPYQVYKIWSIGPDGIDGTVDDIHKNSWDN